MKGRTLVLGSGGREHALVWKLLSEAVDVEAAPGSDAIAELVPVWDFRDMHELISECAARSIKRVVVGPEAYLAEGVQNHLERAGIQCIGPSKQAAQLETDKAWAKDFCKKYGIPSARSSRVEDAQQLESALKDFSPPYVVKASGLAAGKGVWIGDSSEEAIAFGINALKTHRSLVLEEFLQGQELSVFYYVDGDHTVYLGNAQDHKRLLDGDKGPNTGGMGAYSPSSLATETLLERVQSRILNPTIDGLKKESFSFRGFLFLGLMIQNDEPKLLEYNCRLGDPEAQVILSRMDSALSEVFEKPASTKLKLKPQAACGVVVAARGYPSAAEKAFSIGKIPASKNVRIFHSGTKNTKGSWQANGGRLFTALALGNDLQECQQIVYKYLENYSNNAQLIYRKDIGEKEIEMKKRMEN